MLVVLVWLDRKLAVEKPLNIRIKRGASLEDECNPFGAAFLYLFEWVPQSECCSECEVIGRIATLVCFHFLIDAVLLVDKRKRPLVRSVHSLLSFSYRYLHHFVSSGLEETKKTDAFICRRGDKQSVQSRIVFYLYLNRAPFRIFMIPIPNRYAKALCG